ncbi:hypothetical protein THIOSC15_2100009 [uncultured Thiomicrorhabdus sp.]
MNLSRISCYAGECYSDDNGDWVYIEDVEPLIEIVEELATFPTKTRLTILCEKSANLIQESS